MTTYIEKEKLYNERDCLLNDVAEESRLANLNPKVAEEIVNLIYQKFEECLEAIEKPEYEVEDVIQAYRGFVHKLLNRI